MKRHKHLIRDFFVVFLMALFFGWVLVDAYYPVVAENAALMRYWPKSLPSCGGTYNIDRHYQQYRDCPGDGVIHWSCTMPDGSSRTINRPVSYTKNLNMGYNKKQLRDLDAPCGLPVGATCIQEFKWVSRCWWFGVPHEDIMTPLVFDIIAN